VIGKRAAGDTEAALSALTPHELQVAAVVATGATNRQVGAQLFVSAKTVDYHLRNIYRKLGIGTRTELARIVAVADGAGPPTWR
jgi:DNA-binding NarL/FixJ family response regulator